jgi:hypothetical protein
VACTSSMKARITMPEGGKTLFLLLICRTVSKCKSIEKTLVDSFYSLIFRSSLVTGSTNGNFRELFAKAKQIHEKYGPFDVHLCTGNFFGTDTSEESIQALIGNQIDGTTRPILCG